MTTYRHNHNDGFTLIELMIALLIAGILIQVVAPGFQKTIKDNRVRSEVYALRAALNTARSEAITRRQNVVVCAGTEAAGCAVGAEWIDGYIAFVDSDGDNDYTTPATVNDDHLIVAHLPDETDIIDIRLDNNGASFLEYRAQGFTGAPASFEVCDDRTLKDARGLVISAIGYARAATDTDGNDIREDHDGDDFDCS